MHRFLGNDRTSRVATALPISIALISTVFAFAARGEPVRVLVVGDSLSTTGDRYISGDRKGKSFAEQLEIDLGDGYEFINVACPGTTAIAWSLSKPGALCPPHPWDTFPKGILRDRALSQLPVDIATVLLGTNDAVRRQEYGYPSAETYGETLDEIVGALLEGGAGKVVLMTPPGIDNPDAHRRMRAYRDQILARCGSSDRLVCGPDFFSLLDLDTDFATGDDPLRPGQDPSQHNIHPNAHGHARMAQALGTTLRQVAETRGFSDGLVSMAALLALALVVVWVAKKPGRPSSRTPGT